MFEGVIRKGHPGEIAIDDIRISTDVPLENCMGTLDTGLSAAPPNETLRAGAYEGRQHTLFRHSCPPSGGGSDPPMQEVRCECPCVLGCIPEGRGVR